MDTWYNTGEDTIGFHLYVVPRAVKFTETGSRMVLTRGCGGVVGGRVQ